MPVDQLRDAMVARLGNGVCIDGGDKMLVLLTPAADESTLAHEVAHAIDMHTGRWHRRSRAEGEAFANAVAPMLLDVAS